MQGGGKKPGAGSPFGSSGSKSGMPGMGGPGGPAGQGAGSSHRPYQSSNLTPSSEVTGIGRGIKDGLSEFIPEFLRNIVGIKASDSSEEKARKQRMLQNYKQMDAEQQAYVKKKMQEEEMVKRQKEQQAARESQLKQQQKSQQMVMPQGKRTGDPNMAGKSQKQSTISTMNQKRKQLSDPV